MSDQPISQKMSTTKLTLKLLINTTTNKVLFAEATKDVIDFMFGLLEMPLGSIIKLLTSNETISSLGSFGNLYKSIQSLDDTYLQPNQTKNSLLDPLSCKSSLSHTNLLLPAITTTSESNKLYGCTNCDSTVTDIYGIACTQCKRFMMTRAIIFVSTNTVSANASGNAKDGDGLGFVKGVVTYTVMDDLTITPMSTISSISMLNKFNVKDVGGLEEKVVELGFDQGLALLKVSFQSKTALTDVFLKNIR